MKKKTALFLLAAWTAVFTTPAQQTIDYVLNTGLREPHSVIVDQDNQFYLTDSANHRVIRYNPENGLVTNLAGVLGQFGSVNGPGFAAKFFSPRGIVEDKIRGGWVVADSGNHTLRLIRMSGSTAVVELLAGAAGQAGAADGAVQSARFNSPIGLAADSDGNISIADSKNNVIRKLDPYDQVTTLPADFLEPAAVAVGLNGQLFVADTRNHAIKLIEPNGTIRLIAGSPDRNSGTEDSIFAEEALFRSPSGLIWLGGNMGLLVSDTGNHTLRRVYFNPVVQQFFPENTGWSVETYAGKAMQPGFNDGLLSTATFNSPVGMAKDFDGGLLVADLGNNALRRIQTTPRLPRVENPKIGYVEMVFDEFTGKSISKLIPVTDAIFNNDVRIAILPEQTSETFFTFGTTPGLFEEDTIPAPSLSNSQSPPPYRDGSAAEDLPPSLVQPRPDLTIKAISAASGRRPSEVVSARFRFKAAVPLIYGDNPASFLLSSTTHDAEIWYTLDGSPPTNAEPSIGPVFSGQVISLQITEPIVFRARAYKNGFQPSDTATKTFSPTDFLANRISLGFEHGEASSEFVGSAGQRFYAPVTLSLLPEAKMYSLQFNLSVSNVTGPSVAPGAVGFDSMLLRKDESFTPPAYFVIPPQAFKELQVELIEIEGEIFEDIFPVFTDLITTNNASNLLSVGWLERAGKTNLYDTTKQDLITYSQAHNNRFERPDSKVIVGAYSFQVPPGATPDDMYSIQVGRPSATSDGITADVFIDTPINGSLSKGPINALKHVSVGHRQYIVGDSAPFRWLNAGDFGDANLLNNDVMDVFQSAVYLMNEPPAGSDFFDAMDSSNGADNTFLYNGNDTAINQIQFGDGVLNVDDVFVTFRRSLDPSLTWYARFWSNGIRQSVQVPNLFRGSPNLPADEIFPAPLIASETAIPGPPSTLFGIDHLQARPGETVSIPIRAQVVGFLPLRVLMLNLTVESLDAAPPINSSVRFIPNPRLGQPTMQTSSGRANFAAVWLNHKIPGLQGNTTVGTLEFTIPETANAAAAYRIQFNHVSSSPNGVALFPQQVFDGLITLANRSQSSWGDKIPDTWRLLHFGSASRNLAHAAPHADPDADGMSNLAEYFAGTDPMNPRSNLSLSARSAPLMQGAPPQLLLRWLSAPHRQYQVESSSSILGDVWTPVHSGISGTGHELEFSIEHTPPADRFYRLRVLDR
jgi:hypothetical protein